MANDFKGFNRDRPPIHLLCKAANGKMEVACDGELTKVLGEFHRGTGEPWAVTCPYCPATEGFKAVDRPKPGTEN